MHFHANYVSTSVFGDGDYAQATFEVEQDTDDPDSPYLLIQRQFEDPDDNWCYIETHDEKYCGHFLLRRVDFAPQKLSNRARSMPTSPSIPPIIPYGGFSPVRLEGWRFGRRLPNASLSSSLLPAYADHVLVCFRPSCIPSYPRMSRSVSGWLRADAPPWRVGNPPPQGSSLDSGLCCPGLSSLNRPHPPHSQAHHDFAARRLIRNAFAVRERLGDPRVVPGFR